jgi:signal transduction histidine kinase
MADAERVDKGATEADHEQAQREAAASAYHYAEREADRAREDDAKYRAEEDIAGARAEIHRINQEARALLAEIRGREFTENVCAALHHRLREYLDDRKKQFQTITERTDNYWTAVPY